jgi:hypothetical protein
MFRKRRLTNPVANADPGRCEWIQRLRVAGFVTDLWLPAKKQRVADGAKILLDIAKESSDWLGPLKAALGGVSALIKHYEVFV